MLCLILCVFKRGFRNQVLNVSEGSKRMARLKVKGKRQAMKAPQKTFESDVMLPDKNSLRGTHGVSNSVRLAC